MVLPPWSKFLASAFALLLILVISPDRQKPEQESHEQTLTTEAVAKANLHFSSHDQHQVASSDLRWHVSDHPHAHGQLARIGGLDFREYEMAYPGNTWTSIRSRTEGFSNAAGWNWESLYTTLHTVVSNGLYYVLGRGSCGMRIMKVRQDGTIVTANDCGIPFSDDNGWSVESYYSTIRVTVLNDVIYVVGRGSCGLYIYKIVDDTPELVNECEIAFSDANGWDSKKYYSTLSIVPANGELYLTARGGCGMYMFKLYQDKVEIVNVCKIPFSDESGWHSEKYYSTIRTVTLVGHVYVVGRAAQGMVIYRTVAGGEVELVSDGEIPFSDAKWWDSARYYETIRAVTDEATVSVYVLGRSSCGVVIYRLHDGHVSLVSSCQVEFFDFLGWSSVNRYATMDATVIDQAIYVYARDACGMKVYKVYDGTATLVSDCQIEFSNGKWWDLVKYYSSIQGLRGVSGLAISGRSTCGVTIFDHVESGEVHTVAECI